MSKTKKAKALGKGLGALLPSIEFSKDKGIKIAPDDEEVKAGQIPLIDISKVHKNPYQPRKDFDPQALESLKNSIIQHGVIQPITVRREINGFVLISGERRLRASKSAGFDKIPAYIMDVDSGVEMLELALIENLQREDLNPIDEANGYRSLIEECRFTQEQVALKVGKDRSTITNSLRMLKLPEIIQDSLRKRELSTGHARTLLGLSGEYRMIIVWKALIEKGLSVRQTEKLVKDIEAGLIVIDKNGRSKKKRKKKESVTRPGLSEDIAAILDDIEDKLRHTFGTQVKILTDSEESGKIEMEFYSKDDLERILELFDLIDKARK